jgi:hypothetical protein
MTRIHALLLAFFVLFASGASATYYSVTGGGAQFQIGYNRPLPLQLPSTSKGFIGTGTMFPPLLIPVDPDPARALVQQTAGPDPKQITIPPGVLHRPAPGPKVLGVAWPHPMFLQLRTNIDFYGPAPKLGAAVLKAGGRTGPPIASFALPRGGRVLYQKTVDQFGGPLQFRVQPASPVREFVAVILGPFPPCKHPVFGGQQASCQARLVAQYPGTLAPFGAKVSFATVTPGTPAPMSPNVVNVSIPNATGLIAKSASAVKTGSVTDMATSIGFPWTTGRVGLSQPSALALSEKFTITGMDSRMNGVGTISLVSGALSFRALTGPNGNRGWLQLTVPEPDAALGTAGALAALALCHACARRR